jgi:hypothetical protein
VSEDESKAELEERLKEIEKRLGIKSKAEQARLLAANNRLKSKDEVIYGRKRHP